MRKKRTSAPTLFILGYLLVVLGLYLSGFVTRVDILVVPFTLLVITLIIPYFKAPGTTEFAGDGAKYTKAHIIGAILCGGLVLTVYAFTTSASVPILDSYEFGIDTFTIYRIVSYPQIYNYFFSPVYSLYFFIAKILVHIPLGTEAFRVSFLSGVYGAVCVSLLYLLFVKLSTAFKVYKEIPYLRTVLPAVLSLTFGFSQLFWSQAVIPEVYTFNLMLLTLVMLLTAHWSTKRDKKYLVLLNILLMLLIDLHLSNLIFIPLITAYLFYKDRSLLQDTTYWLSALSGLLLVFGIITLNRFANLDLLGFTDQVVTLYRIFYGSELQEFFLLIMERAQVLLKQFGSLGMGLALLGFILNLRNRKNVYMFLVASQILSHLVFFTFFYDAKDIKVFYLPAILLISLYIFWGASALLDRNKVWVKGILPQTVSAFPKKRMRSVMFLFAAALPVAIPLIGNWKINDMKFLDQQKQTFQTIVDAIDDQDLIVCHEEVNLFCQMYGHYWIHQTRLATGTRDFPGMPYVGIMFGTTIDESLPQEVHPTDSGEIYLILHEPWANNYLDTRAHPEIWLVPEFIFEMPLPQNQPRDVIYVYKLAEAASSEFVKDPPGLNQTPIFSDDRGWYGLLDVQVEPHSILDAEVFEIQFTWQIFEQSSFLPRSHDCELKFSSFADPFTYEIGLGNLQRIKTSVSENWQELVIVDTFHIMRPPGNEAFEIYIDGKRIYQE
jgi:hypothetical protein